MIQTGTHRRSRRDFLKTSTVALATGLLASRASLSSVEAKILRGEALDEAEIHHLEFIREEEKLARDVYMAMAAEYANPVFGLIIESEQSHMDAMLNLLNYYGIDDPAREKPPGQFADAYIQELYDDLVPRGLGSEDQALMVGGFIEEYDILDIWRAVDDTAEDRIIGVYTNLYEGSYNHLRAYVYNYEKYTGEAYSPQLMEEDTFAECIDAETQAKQKQNG